MTQVVVLSRNIMDSSKIKSATSSMDNVVVCNGLDKLQKIFNNDVDDLKIIIDYYLYDTKGFDVFIKEVRSKFTNGDTNVEYLSFIPHELIDEFADNYPDIVFVPRSLFFHDITKYCST